jgi:hypothetical protein
VWRHELEGGLNHGGKQKAPHPNNTTGKSKTGKSNARVKFRRAFETT